MLESSTDVEELPSVTTDSTRPGGEQEDCDSTIWDFFIHGAFKALLSLKDTDFVTDADGMLGDDANKCKGRLNSVSAKGGRSSS